MHSSMQPAQLVSVAHEESGQLTGAAHARHPSAFGRQALTSPSAHAIAFTGPQVLEQL